MRIEIKIESLTEIARVPEREEMPESLLRSATSKWLPYAEATSCGRRQSTAWALHPMAEIRYPGIAGLNAESKTRLGERKAACAISVNDSV